MIVGIVPARTGNIPPCARAPETTTNHPNPPKITQITMRRAQTPKRPQNAPETDDRAGPGRPAPAPRHPLRGGAECLHCVSLWWRQETPNGWGEPQGRRPIPRRAWAAPVGNARAALAALAAHAVHRPAAKGRSAPLHLCMIRWVFVVSPTDTLDRWIRLHPQTLLAR